MGNTLYMRLCLLYLIISYALLRCYTLYGKELCYCDQSVALGFEAGQDNLQCLGCCVIAFKVVH